MKGRGVQVVVQRDVRGDRVVVMGEEGLRSVNGEKVGD
jgi:hypothetical protein